VASLKEESSKKLLKAIPYIGAEKECYMKGLRWEVHFLSPSARIICRCRSRGFPNSPFT
jgi:hypothetical protein